MKVAVMASAGSSAAFAHSGFFVLRAPALPFDTLTAAEPAGGDTSEAGRARLRRLLDLPAVSEAVFVASPSLHAQLDVWRRDPDSEAGKKVEQALVRYVARMAGRSTPFGLFAGCSVGGVDKATRLGVGECRGHTRLDMDYVVLLADALSRDPELRRALRFTPNSSLYRVAGRARYREVRRKDKGWTHHRAVLEVPDYLDVVLARAAGGATPGDLTRVLLDHDPEATEAEAAEYVGELIAQQVLVSELVPAVTGTEPVHGLIERLAQSPAGASAGERLARVRDELLSLDARAPGAPTDRYRAIAARLAELPAPVDESRLFQVDLMRPGGDATLGENVVAEIARGVELLRRLTPPPADDPLAAFRQAFAARFGDTEVTREVPLAEALDDETGVGFAEDSGTIEASSLLEGLELSPPPEIRVAWGPRETHLLGRLTEALARGEQELTLTEKDIERMAVKHPLPLPDAFAAMLRLEAASSDAVARGDFRLFLQGAMGPSGARLLGRFCHADPDLAAAVERHLRAEEALRPDAVFAEVVHLPEGRVGNILARPACRAYEIPYLGRSGAPAERQIPLSDLLVSVVGGRVVLRSARLGREVLPRLTSAHNFGASTGVYRFLCALQAQGVAPGLGWDWGPLAGSAFLPRVAYGRLVLARAQWRVTPEEASRLREAGFPGVRRWREERRLPRWVCLVEADNELPIDLDDRLMAETLLKSLRDSAALTELFPAPDRLCATGPEGRYVHEMVVPFVRRESEGVRGPAAPQPPSLPARRVFAPGSEWLSLKLYAGPLVVEELVRDVVGPLAEGLGRPWFFVRYADPHGHLRVRFRGEGALAAVQEAVAPLLAEGRIWKVQIDTYEREIERYGGGAGIEASEQIFWRDSEAVVDLIRLPEDDGRGDRRWRLALLGMDRLLGDLGLDLEGRHAVLLHARDAWRAEFRMSAEATARVGAKYRAESAALADLLGLGPGWSEARAVLDRRSEDVARAAAALRAAAGRRLVEDIAGSLLHMHANRLLRSAARTHELVLYDFLCRHYEGQLARRPGAGGSA